MLVSISRGLAREGELAAILLRAAEDMAAVLVGKVGGRCWSGSRGCAKSCKGVDLRVRAKPWRSREVCTAGWLSYKCTCRHETCCTPAPHSHTAIVNQLVVEVVV